MHTMMSDDDIHFLAYYDQLTKLANRNKLVRDLAKMIDACKLSREKMAAIFIDLDDFKKINDTFGHLFGDKVLIEVANRLLSLFRESDLIVPVAQLNSMISRFGGDEFIVILQNIQNKKQIWRIVDRINDSINNKICIDGHDVMVKASIGISVFPDDGENLQELIEKADIAMYAVKNDPSSMQYAFYDGEKHTVDEKQLFIESDLVNAIEKNQFELFYQAQVDLESRRISGVESLLRWKHPVLGYISPTQFIPIAEHSGYITLISQWVVKRLFETISHSMPKLQRNLVFSFNVSAKDFLEESFLTYLVGIADHYQIPKSMICIEITESMIMRNLGQALKNMEFLAAQGFKIAIDDFGTGHSSFTYLHKFPIHKLKIDRGFIESITLNEKSEIITGSIIDMCNKLNIKVIAEGVETEAQVITLRDLSCMTYQGFYFSRPQPIKHCLSEVTDITLLRSLKKL